MYFSLVQQRHVQYANVFKNEESIIHTSTTYIVDIQGGSAVGKTIF